MNAEEMQAQFDEQSRKIDALEEALRRTIDAISVLSERVNAELDDGSPC